MPKNFAFAEDLMVDEGFRDWYFKKNTPAAKELVSWIETDPQNNMLLEETIQLMDSIYMAEESISEPQIKAAKQRLFDAIGKTGSEPAPVITMKRTRMKNYWIAAAAVLLIASAATWLLLSGKTKNGINADYGQITESNLPDGSVVALNANSSVTLSDGWDKNKDREVWLKGEAFFKVKKKENQQKFIVHTDQLDVIVTGTQFNVLNRNGKTTVLLTEGSVTLQTKNGDNIFMKPGDFVEINSSKLEKKTGDPEKILAWRENKIVFENTTMQEAIQIISEHYNVKIDITDPSISGQRITGILPNDNLDVLLKSLEAVMDFRITRDNNYITISNR